MLRVGLNRARPGMVLGMPVFHPRLSGHVLLRPGFELDAVTVGRLREMQVEHVWIRYPALADVLRYVSPEIAYEHAALASMVGRAMDRARDPEHAELDFVSYAQAVHCLVDKLHEHREAGLLIHDLVMGESTLALHSGNVGFLAVLMGLKLEHYLVEERKKVSTVRARKVENLGVGALLHDVGMVRIPRSAVERFECAGDESDPAWRRHVEHGFAMVRGRVEPSAAACVLHHHQRYDGTGFPASAGSTQARRPPRGSEIHIFARITAVADLYDRLRNPPGTRGEEARRVPAVRVLRAMVHEARRRRIDPVVLKALLQCVPAYAPGTFVRLNNGQQAVVLSFDPLDPCRPCVRQIRHTSIGAEICDEWLGEVYDLRDCPRLKVVESEGQNVSGDEFRALTPDEFDLRYTFPPEIPPARTRSGYAA